uniref:Chitin-binding type-2 domain-containing protein n=1 Tax=Timema tahoe TaxID=61484 RepID=A0A7R9FGW5_9NEOP|nr:unnamed protein product [Timema tahoe]
MATVKIPGQVGQFVGYDHCYDHILKVLLTRYDLSSCDLGPCCLERDSVRSGRNSRAERVVYNCGVGGVIQSYSSYTCPQTLHNGCTETVPGPSDPSTACECPSLMYLLVSHEYPSLMYLLASHECPSLMYLLVSQWSSCEDKCPEKTGYFPDPVQCDLYYKCSQGQPEEKLCPDGLVFDDTNPNSARCDIPANIDCGDRTELREYYSIPPSLNMYLNDRACASYDALFISSEDPRPSPGCPRANGYFRHSDPQVCDKFFNCVEGVTNELPCPPGLIYDDIRSTCAWPSESHRTDCFNSKKGECYLDMTDCFNSKKGECYLDMTDCFNSKKGECYLDRTNFFNSKKGECYLDMTDCFNSKKGECYLYMTNCFNSKKGECYLYMTNCFNSKKDLLDDGFSCPDGEVIGPTGRALPHPTYPHPEDCQKFYICRNGVMPQKGSCPGGLVYNEVSFKCDEPENVVGCEKWFDEENKRNGNN